MGSSKIQGELWGADAREWAELQEPLHTPMWETMLSAAEVGKGTRFFDAGCGGGGASVLAAQRGAQISGLDASEALIAIAHERIPLGEFRVGDLEALPYEDKVFDAVIASLSVQYTASPITSLRELKRVCVPEGLFAISTWSLAEYCDQSVVLNAIKFTLPSPPAGEGPFALSGSGALESLVEAAGWTVIGSCLVDCTFEYKDLETHWRAQRSGGPAQSAIRIVGEERLRAAVDRAVEPYRTSSGGVRLENRFRCVTATQ